MSYSVPEEHQRASTIRLFVAMARKKSPDKADESFAKLEGTMDAMEYEAEEDDADSGDEPDEVTEAGSAVDLHSEGTAVDETDAAAEEDMEYEPRLGGCAIPSNVLELMDHVDQVGAAFGLRPDIRDKPRTVEMIFSLPCAHDSKRPPSAQARDAWSCAIAQRSLRCAQMTDKLMQLGSEMAGSRQTSSTLQTLLQGLSTKRKESIPADFIDVGLWRAVQDYTYEACERIQNTASASNESKSTGHDATSSTNPVATTAFRNFYLQHLTDTFSRELDGVRKSDQMDEHGILTLAECLENGINIFTDFEKELFTTRVLHDL